MIESREIGGISLPIFRTNNKQESTENSEIWVERKVHMAGY